MKRLELSQTLYLVISKMSFKLKTSVILFTASLVLVGCAHTICIKVVDADTKKPLAGVSTWWLQCRQQMFAPIKHEGPTNLPPSGNDGIIKLTRVHRWWVNELAFSCPGYSNVYGICYLRGEMSLGNAKSDFPGDFLEPEFFLQGTVTGASRSDGCYTVPMHK